MERRNLMFSRSIRITLTLFYLSLPALATAQEKVEMVRASFRTLPVLSADWNGIFYQPAPEAPMQEIFFSSLSRSFTTYEYEGPKRLFFYRENGVDDKGEMTYRRVAAVEINATEMLIFFKLNPQNKDEPDPEFKLLAIDDSPEGLPMNHIAFINMTGANFACRFIDKNMFLETGLTGPISLEESLNKSLFIGLAVMNETTQRVVAKNTWEFQSGNRHLILLLPPKKWGSFRIRAYRITEYVGENQRFNPNWKPLNIGEEGPVTKL